MPSRRTFVIGFLGTVGLIVGALLLARPGESAPEPAMPLKIAVVDTQTVFEQYVKTEDANKTLESAYRKLEAQGKALNDEIRKLEERVTKQRLFIDDQEKIRQMEGEINAKKEELRRLVQTGQDALDEKQKELTEPILKEIRDVIQEIGKRDGYDIIQEKRLVVLYHRPGMDITDEVVQILNSRAAATSSEEGQTGATATSSDAGADTPKSESGAVQQP